MPTIFTKIINGEIPGRFVYKDDRVVAFLTIAPLKPGHTLVVPRQEVEHWIDLDPATAGRLITVAQKVGRAIHAGFPCRKVAITVLGLEVPHVHFHLVPIDAETEMHMDRQDHHAKPADLDRAAATLRAELKKQGVREVAE
ncbi:MAG: HIT family protein [Phycisphaeraceae bacterium]|nr:HIT family protein [Phycisphaeraceae bacterium]